MTSNARAGARILGSLRSADGKGVVRMQDRFDTDIDDVWSALTDPLRLARWIGKVGGDLRVGGEYHFHFYASGAEGTGRVEVCDPPHRLLLAHGLGQQQENVIEVMLTADGDQTILIAEERGMPLNLLAAYGAGVQVHVEDLAAHLAGRERCDASARWDELQPAYEDLAAKAAIPRADADDQALLAFLTAQRGVVLSIVSGLDEEAWHRSIVPSGWTPAGLVEHLGGAEWHWFQGVVAGVKPEPRPEDEDRPPYDPMAAFVSDLPAAEIIAFYRDQCASSDAVLAATQLSAQPRGKHGNYEPPDVRWVVLHMIEETARHAGHLDIARELLDGQTRLGAR